ncbi:hypothetical protein GDO81_014913 [Engystomops pustulosus]|uniref:Uncharacterized protein n=1 Tax=Engystomops pustulosus TaxID=76066 RepID=A0AAV7AFJ9_ENGPU|nr:hypothetical protein GDO81_014913 [Engystomops pustulosus]
MAYCIELDLGSMVPLLKLCLGYMTSGIELDLGSIAPSMGQYVGSMAHCIELSLGSILWDCTWVNGSIHGTVFGIYGYMHRTIYDGL